MDKSCFALLFVFGVICSCSNLSSRSPSSELTDSASTTDDSQMTARRLWVDQQCGGAPAYKEDSKKFDICVGKLSIDQKTDEIENRNLQLLVNHIEVNRSAADYRKTEVSALRFKDGDVLTVSAAQLQTLSSADLEKYTTIEAKPNRKYYALLFGSGNHGVMRVLMLENNTDRLFMYGKKGGDHEVEEIAEAQSFDILKSTGSKLGHSGISPQNIGHFKERWPKLEHRGAPNYQRAGLSPFLN